MTAIQIFLIIIGLGLSAFGLLALSHLKTIKQKQK